MTLSSLQFWHGIQILQKIAQKLNINAKYNTFWKSEVYGQTVLPDRSFLRKQTWVENAKVEKFKYDILSYFQKIVFEFWRLKSNSREIQFERFFWLN